MSDPILIQDDQRIQMCLVEPKLDKIQICTSKFFDSSAAAQYASHALRPDCEPSHLLFLQAKKPQLAQRLKRFQCATQSSGDHATHPIAITRPNLELVHWAWLLSGAASAAASVICTVNMAGVFQLGYLCVLLVSSAFEIMATRIIRHIQ
ncbi:hypothetical protein DOTSEDRAFT_22000 [Dothistroma septosporum NZE10]|uniref:Uncharacterized protein n=1 Tax=Dothistroma septosporum (strain NZE10 / CBS 128990) TaxID=675120 RepID=N1Q0Z0_DOTSN|nr:hypothetical protein DOTSEDRAFT_22000 [Dothistroma septosporum NZE10]